EACGGKRFNRQTLQVGFDVAEGPADGPPPEKPRTLDIHDVLELSVRQALATFERVPPIRRRLELMNDIGLGYLKLGQPSPTLSGGESQRIKLVNHLVGR